MNLKIGISQRRLIDKHNNRIYDSLDSEWISYSKYLNLELFPIPNSSNIITLLESQDFDGFILSGGNNVQYKKKSLSTEKDYILKHDISPIRDSVENNIIEYSINNNIPLIGICRGMQMINFFFNGKISKIPDKSHVAVYHDVSIVDDYLLNFYDSPCSVNSYHDFGITINDLSKELIKTSICGKYVESFIHKKFKIHGIMWHPERESKKDEFDLEYIKHIFKK